MVGFEGPDLGSHPRACGDRIRTGVPAVPRRPRCLRGGAQEGRSQAIGLTSGAEIARPGRDIDGMLLERGQRDDLQGPLVGGGQDHVSGGAVMVGPKPVDRSHAPSIAGHQAGKSELGHRGDQVVSDRTLVLQELGGHHRTDGVAAEVLRAGCATPVPVEPGQGFRAARLSEPPKTLRSSISCSCRARCGLRPPEGPG